MNLWNTPDIRKASYPSQPIWKDLNWQKLIHRQTSTADDNSKREMEFFPIVPGRRHFDAAAKKTHRDCGYTVKGTRIFFRSEESLAGSCLWVRTSNCDLRLFQLCNQSTYKWSQKDYWLPTYLRLGRIALKFTFNEEHDSLKFLLRLRQMIKN